ncbi:MAG TPA: hypothetical protein VMU43_00950 [Candidatus Acidoferrum sp.]|nr:hypothetical protein [Candidatus Acidoferrum sp.]
MLLAPCSSHFSVQAGYLQGLRLVVNTNDATSRMGLRLTQQGAITGWQFSL